MSILASTLQSDGFKAFLKEHCIFNTLPKYKPGTMRVGSPKLTVELTCPLLEVSYTSKGQRSQFKNRAIVLDAMAITYLNHYK